MNRLARHLPDMVMLIPMGLAQLGIGLVVLREGRKRGSKKLLSALFLAVLLFWFIMFTGVLCGIRYFAFKMPWLPWHQMGIVHLVTFSWGVCSTAAFAIYLAYALIAPRLQPRFQPERRRWLHAAAAAAVVSPFAAMAYGTFVQRLNFQVQEVDIPLKDLPKDLQGLRILQLSDIHLSSFLSEKDLERVVGMSNELNAHIAVMTGDLITDPSDPVDVCITQLARVKCDAPMLGCLGNHETYAGILEYTKAKAARYGITFLRSENRVLRFGDASLNFAGVDYEPFFDKPRYLTGAEKLMVPGSTNILLSHNPDVFPVAARKGYDLTLSGHTHGGQVTIEILNQTANLARVFTRYVSGYYQIGEKTCYVTRGIGTIGLPTRLGAPPEITLLRLRKA